MKDKQTAERKRKPNMGIKYLTYLDQEIHKSATAIAVVESRLDMIEKDIASVKSTLDGIKVNGRRGLNEALQDIYAKLDSLTAEERKRFWNRPLRETLGFNTVLGRMIWFLLFYLALAAVFHTFGINLPFSDLLKIVSRAPIQ